MNDSIKNSIVLWGVVVGLVGGFCGTVAAAGMEDIIRNPSMEGAFVGGVAEEWTGWGTTYGSFYESDTDHGGSKSQEVWYGVHGWTSIGRDGIYQVLTNLEPGKTYEVSVWSILEHWDGYGWGSLSCELGINTQGSTDPYDIAISWVGGELSRDAWREVKCVFVAEQSVATLFVGVSGEWDNQEEVCWPDYDDPSIWVCNFYPIYGDVSCIIDDVLVYKLTPGEIHVDAGSANDPGTGTRADPYRRIQDAMDAAGAGDEIHVAGGEYGEVITVKDGVDLYGGYDSGDWDAARDWESRETIINGAGLGDSVVRIVDANSVIEGFTITNG